MAAEEPTTKDSGPVRILHLADLHLGAPCAFLGEQAAAQRARIQQAFETALKLAEQRDCDLILIAGDLFDSNNPSEALLRQTRRLLANTHKPVVIIPGTHDRLKPGSIYLLPEWGDQCPQVRLCLNPSGERFDFPELELSVYAVPNAVENEGSDPVASLPARSEMRWHVALAHGAVAIPGRTEQAAYPISPESIATCGMDYVALGDWHSLGDYSQGDVRAFYPGALEPLASDEDKTGHALLVTLGDSGVHLEPIRLGTSRAERVQFSCDSFESPQALVEEVRRHADANTLLTVELRGMKPSAWSLNPEELEETLRGEFLALRLEDHSLLRLSDTEMAQFQTDFVLGAFVRIMQERIQQARAAQDEALARAREEALQLGLAALQGHEVI